jgi:hypothetical protein
MSVGKHNCGGGGESSRAQYAPVGRGIEWFRV